MWLDYETANSLLKAMEGEVVTAIEQDGWRRILNTQTRSPDAPKLVSKDKSRDAEKRSIDQISRTQGCLLGLAIGDAIGTTTEFKPRGSFAPITDMVGGGPLDLRAGQWTDDTSMALCLATSLIECGFDMQDQLNRYLNWLDHGYMSSKPTCFDIGVTTSIALKRYRITENVFSGSVSPRTAGNGCIMRLAPVVLYFQDFPSDAIRYCAEQARSTHGAPECLVACKIMAQIMIRALQGISKEAVLAPIPIKRDWTQGLKDLARSSYLEKSAEQIHGSGYVVQSLEAALWCFGTTDSFSDCLLAAANLGDDADTTAAIAGQIAGAYYGLDAIPQKWVSRVYLGEAIHTMAYALYRNRKSARKSL